MDTILLPDQAKWLLMELRSIKRVVKRAERSIEKTFSKGAIFVFADKSALDDVMPIIGVWKRSQEE